MPDHDANYKRQGSSLEYLRNALPGFYVPTGAEKLEVLSLLGVSKGFKQTFDALRLHVASFADVRSAKDFDLLEIKATDKFLPSLPNGFFFGMTENERNAAEGFRGQVFPLFGVAQPEIAQLQVGWVEGTEGADTA
jgi:hypothetical protein